MIVAMVRHASRSSGATVSPREAFASSQMSCVCGTIVVVTKFRSDDMDTAEGFCRLNRPTQSSDLGGPDDKPHAFAAVLGASVSLSADPRLSDFLKHGALARCERGDY